MFRTFGPMSKFTQNDNTMHKHIHSVFTSRMLIICSNKDFLLLNKTTHVFVFVVKLSLYHMTFVTYFHKIYKKFTKKGDNIIIRLSMNCTCQSK